MPESPRTESPREGPPSGRQRLRDSLLKPGRPQVVVAVLLAIVGFALMTQVRANQQDATFQGLRDQDLRTRLSAAALRHAEIFSVGAFRLALQALLQKLGIAGHG